MDEIRTTRVLKKYALCVYMFSFLGLSLLRVPNGAAAYSSPWSDHVLLHMVKVSSEAEFLLANLDQMRSCSALLVTEIILSCYTTDYSLETIQ